MYSLDDDSDEDLVKVYSKDGNQPEPGIGNRYADRREYGGSEQSQNPADYTDRGIAYDDPHRYDAGYFDDPSTTRAPIVKNRASIPGLNRAPDSMDADLPLAQSGAMPAGSSLGGAPIYPSTPGGVQGWTGFDEDDEEQLAIGTGSASRGAGAKQKGKRKARDCWEGVLTMTGIKKKALTGERTIHIGDQSKNAASAFINNYVSTSKYNLVTFLPKFFFEQFSKYANLFFLFSACIQQIPNVSPTNRYTTIVPLAAVLLVAAIKEMQEDIKRHQSDRELNARKAKVLDSGRFVDKAWRNIRVGDIVRLEGNDFFPADMLILASSEPDGLCYIETSNLDGETNLKIKQSAPATSHFTSPEAVQHFAGYLRSEQPNSSLYTYEGTLILQGGGGEKTIPMSPDQMLLRGAQLRNTSWMYGLVVFTGHETKLMLNATAAPIKRTAVEKMVNVQIIFLFIILLALSIGSSVGTFVRTYVYQDQMWYLLLQEESGSRVRAFVEDVLTFIILYNNLIPISLIVTMEVVKFQQAVLINSDLDMYYPKSDTPALCRTSSLVEELGQIEYIFSDKTGTLTRNEMEFRQCSIAGVAYSDVVDESKQGEIFTFQDLAQNLAAGDEQARVINEFLTLLATCHTVIPDEKDGKIVYQASSPDEAALVDGASTLGYKFTTRKPQSIFVESAGQSREYQVLNICEFNSTRKRMSSIIRMPDGSIKLFTKGADTVILERLAEGQAYTDVTFAHLEDYATEGLRTLCIAMRDIPEEEYRQWAALYTKAAATINGRQDELDKVAEMIECNLFLLGATAIEDKLQEGVPDTIFTLQQAGIKVWVLTGDRQETAINIGMSCRLISESMSLVIVNETSQHGTTDFITKKLLAIKSQKTSGDLEELALIIDGTSLKFALEKGLSKQFLELATMCKAVICCRVSPLQKALVVKLVKKNLKSILLAIGDGANDVSMIQAAHIGVGISGLEGLQAARSADIAISQFRFLKKLLLVHGTWSYSRLCKLILYSFYKNIVLYMIGFYFSFSNSFSGQVLFESWTFTFYNVFFTVLPPVVIGVFDQFVSARMLDRYPELYQLGQNNAFFGKRIFWAWVANALYHSIVIYAASVVIFWGSLILIPGWDAGQWIWGTTVYLAVLGTVLGKAALISDLWTRWTVLAIPGSYVFTIIFLVLYMWIAPMLNLSKEYQGIVPRLFTSPVFYLTIILLPVFCLTRDFTWKAYKRLYRPEPYHIVQEIQAFNLPDYRPRMEQFQKAIKKVRAVQRMRRNRGFAFSQTEEGQEQIIRSYDTTVQKLKG